MNCIYPYNILLHIPDGSYTNHYTTGESDYYEEHEKITDCYIEDGRVYVFSWLDEETSESIVKERLDREYTGQKVISKYVADAKTYELYWTGVYIEGDEDIKNAEYREIRYDEPEPEQRRYIRAFLSGRQRNMMKNVQFRKPDIGTAIRIFYYMLRVRSIN